MQPWHVSGLFSEGRWWRWNKWWKAGWAQCLPLVCTSSQKTSLALPSLHTPFMSRVFDQIAVGDHHMNTTTEHKLHWSNYQHDNIIDKLEGYHYMPINISIASKIMAPHSEIAQLGKPSPSILHIFIGPESDHLLCLSVTNSLTPV